MKLILLKSHEILELKTQFWFNSGWVAMRRSAIDIFVVEIIFVSIDVDTKFSFNECT